MSIGAQRSWVLHRMAVVLAVGVLPAACGSSGAVVDAGAAPTRPAAEPTAAPQAPSPAPTVRPDGASSALRSGDRGTGGVGGPDTGGAGDAGTAGDGGAAGERSTVAVYFTRGEQVAAVPRRVPRVARIGAAAMEQLLAGPTTDEAAAGYATQIPAGTRLRGLTITDRVATVDLSGAFESGGGTLGLTLRLAQVACTLDAFPTVDGVRFALDGEVVDVFSGDGLIVDEPVACGDYIQVSSDDAT